MKSKTNKIKDIHIQCVSTDRQRVNLALQLISRSADLFKKYFPNDKEKMALAGFNELATTCWKLMTSKTIFHEDIMCSALRVDIEKQSKPLKEFVNVMEKIKFINKKGQAGRRLFQNGIILTITATLELQKNLKENYNIPYLCVNRTNQY